MGALNRKLSIGFGVAALVGMGALDAEAQRGQWTQSQTSLAVATADFAIDRVNSRVVLAGGGSGNQALGTVAVLSIQNGRISGIERRPNLAGEVRLQARGTACGDLLLVGSAYENGAESRASNELLAIPEQLGVGSPRNTNFLTNPAHRPQSAVVGDGTTALLVGGLLRGNPSNRTQAFDCTSVTLATGVANSRAALNGNPWVERAPIPMTVIDADGAFLSGANKFVVVGGRADDMAQSQVLNATQIFDNETNTWTMGAPMPTARFDHAVAALNENELVVIGGTDARNRVLDVVEIYNISMDQWTTAASLPTALTKSGAANTGPNRVVLAGGTPEASRGEAVTTIFEFQAN